MGYHTFFAAGAQLAAHIQAALRIGPMAPAWRLLHVSRRVIPDLTSASLECFFSSEFKIKNIEILKNLRPKPYPPPRINHLKSFILVRMPVPTPFAPRAKNSHSLLWHLVPKSDSLPRMPLPEVTRHPAGLRKKKHEEVLGVAFWGKKKITCSLFGVVISPLGT